MNTELNKAVCAVMSEVHSLKKAEDNKHGNYKYVSVDAFKDFVRPLMAKHGLSLSQNEVDFALDTVQGRNGPTVVARITYEFIMRHTSGEVDPAERATIVLPYTGAQTAGAAKSYVIKEYMKGKFLVSTGDKDLIEGGADADAYKQQEYTAAPKAVPQEEPRPSAMPTVTGTPGASKAAFREPFAAMQKAIRNTASKRELKALWEDNMADIDEWPPEFVDQIKVIYLDHKSDLDKRLAA